MTRKRVIHGNTLLEPKGNLGGGVAQKEVEEAINQGPREADFPASSKRDAEISYKVISLMHSVVFLIQLRFSGWLDWLI